MAGEVTRRVEWSRVNYKDGLAVRRPGAGRPSLSDDRGRRPRRHRRGSPSHPRWRAGDKVICTGWGMGETHLGAYAEMARVRGEWLVRLAGGNVGARRDGDRHRRLYRSMLGGAWLWKSMA